MNSYVAGISALDRGDYRPAVDCFTRALELDPRDIDALLMRASAYLHEHDFEHAGVDVANALRLAPRSARGFYLRGLLAEATGCHGRAEADFERAKSCDDDGLLDEFAAWQRSDQAAAESTAPPEMVPTADVAAPPELVSWAEAAPPPRDWEPSDEWVGAAAELPLALSNAAVPVSVLTKLEQLEAVGRMSWGAVGRAGLTSCLVHAAALVSLGLMVGQRLQSANEQPAMLLTMGEPNAPLVVEAASMPIEAPIEAPIEQALVPIPVPSPVVVPSIPEPPVMPLAQAMVVLEPVELSAPVVPAPLDEAKVVEGSSSLGGGTGSSGSGTGQPSAGVVEPPPMPPSELAESRTREARRLAMMTRGGTPATEVAVEKALDWLARHQNDDGSWSFNHQFCPHCHGQCPDPGGMVTARNGATAMGLLPFLGAGYTHREDKYGGHSPYHQTVAKGLKFLVNNMQHGGPVDGSMYEPGGRMYSHGLAAIALCEAYGMTQDRELLAPAQRAVKFIVVAQDPQGGGWRYQPQQAGDTSVVAWQLMALKSAHLSYIKVPDATVAGASRFFDYVQIDGGSQYGYINSVRSTIATSAAGLLCRMYLGWKRESPALMRGMEYLGRLGPSGGDMYYNYYATQALHHFEGPLWTEWNKKMREDLVDTQAREGHAAGSWFFAGDRHGAMTGGRLYSTSLAAMTLEVYYRYMPLYTKHAAEAGLGQ